MLTGKDNIFFVFLRGLFRHFMLTGNLACIDIVSTLVKDLFFISIIIILLNKISEFLICELQMGPKRGVNILTDS